LFRGTSCKMPLAWGVQFVLLVGVAVADMQPDVVAGVVRFVVWDGVQVASCVGRTLTFFCRRGCGGREGARGGGGVRAALLWRTGKHPLLNRRVSVTL